MTNTHSSNPPADPHANIYDGARNEREKEVLQAILYWMHHIEARDGNLIAHQFTLAFKKETFTIRVEEVLEVHTFTD